MSRIPALRAFLEKKPTDRFALYALAMELRKDLDPEAEIRFRELLTAYPEAGPAWLQFGNLYTELERLDDAIGVWREGLVALKGRTDADSKKAYGEIEAALISVDAD